MGNILNSNKKQKIYNILYGACTAGTILANLAAGVGIGYCEATDNTIKATQGQIMQYTNPVNLNDRLDKLNATLDVNATGMISAKVNNQTSVAANIIGHLKAKVEQTEKHKQVATLGVAGALSIGLASGFAGIKAAKKLNECEDEKDEEMVMERK